jgi:hypothetical protein
MDGCGGTTCSRIALVFTRFSTFPGFHHFLLYVRSSCQSMVTVRLPMQPFRGFWSGGNGGSRRSALVFEVRTRVSFAIELVVYIHGQAQLKHIADGYLHVSGRG